jgi:hypothetical protein
MCKKKKGAELRSFSLLALPIYSPWQSKADHLQRQALSAWRLEKFVGNCSAFRAERN